MKNLRHLQNRLNTPDPDAKETKAALSAAVLDVARAIDQIAVNYDLNSTHLAARVADDWDTTQAQNNPNPANENRIVEVKAVLRDGQWKVEIVKEFAPEYGGGEQTFEFKAGSIHHALDIARSAVTASPGNRDQGYPDAVTRIETA